MKEKNEKYCIHCGAKNKKENKICKECKKLFIDDYNEISYFLADYITGDIKGNIFEFIKNFISKFLGKLLYGIIVTVSLISTVNIISSKVIDHEETTNTPINYLTEKRLENDANLIKKLFNNTRKIEVYTKQRNYEEEMLYRSKSIKLTELDDKVKLAFAAVTFTEENFDIFHNEIVTDCNAWTKYPEAINFCQKKLSTIDGITHQYEYMSWYDITKKEIAESYKKLFNTEIKENKSFYVGNFYYCEWNDSINDYFCYYNNDESIDNIIVNSHLIEGRTYEDRIEIDTAVTLCEIDTTGNTCHLISDKNKMVAKLNDDDIDDVYWEYTGKSKGDMYTLVYLKDIENNYFLYSIENKNKEYIDNN